MKSPQQTFHERSDLFADPVEVALMVLDITQPLYEEIEKLKHEIERLMPDPNMSAASMDVTRAPVAGFHDTNAPIPGSLKGVYKGAGK